MLRLTTASVQCLRLSDRFFISCCFDVRWQNQHQTVGVREAPADWRLIVRVALHLLCGLIRLRGCTRSLPPAYTCTLISYGPRTSSFRRGVSRYLFALSTSADQTCCDHLVPINHCPTPPRPTVACWLARGLAASRLFRPSFKSLITHGDGAVSTPSLISEVGTYVRCCFKRR